MAKTSKTVKTVLSSLGNWARETKNSRGANCLTCTQHPEAAKDIKTVLEIWASGKGHPNTVALCRKLEEVHQYPLSDTALRRHMQKCEAELWSKVTNRNG